MSAVPPNPRNPNDTVPLSTQEQENLTAYLDHELDEPGTEAVTAALSRRPEVRREAESLRKTWDLLDYLPRPKAPTSFTEQTITRLNSTKGILLQQGMKWRRYAIAGWAACLVTAAAFGFWFTYSFNRPPDVVEVAGPETEVIPQLVKTSQQAPTSPETIKNENRALKKEAKQSDQAQEIQRRNLRLARQISRLYFEVRKHLNEAEEDRLIKLSHEGGILYMAAIIELANKYKIPLIDPRETGPNPPNKGGKKTAGKGSAPGE